MKRRPMRDRDEAAGREQAERRLEDLLARLRDREATARTTPDEPAEEPATEPETPEVQPGEDDPAQRPSAE